MGYPLRLAFVLCLAVAVAGCDTITSVHPIGEPFTGEQVNDIDAADFLNGVWVGPDDDMVVHLHYLGEGELHIGGGKWKDGVYEASELPAKLTSHEDALYLNLSNPDDPEEGYTFMRLIPAGQNALILLMPQADYFAQAVDQQRIAGEVKRSDQSTGVTLAGTKEQLDALIRQGEVGVQFMVGRPLLFRKVSNKSD